VVSIGGHPALGTGGSRSSDGESGGALLDTSDHAPVHLQVAPWHASATGQSASTRRSRASAAAARAEVPKVAKAGVLTSESQAEHADFQSTGSSRSDALDLGLGDATRLVLLHSEASSSGTGHSYLLGLNGTKIGTDDQLGKSCALDAAGVAQLTCLTASGGIANGLTSGAAEVLGVNTTLGLNPVSAFRTAASAGTGSIPPSILPALGVTLPSTDTARAVTPETSTAAALPRTGAAVASLAASALAALLSGLVLRLLGRRRLAA
jgi:hypothetical protein